MEDRSSTTSLSVQVVRCDQRVSPGTSPEAASGDSRPPLGYIHACTKCHSILAGVSMCRWRPQARVCSRDGMFSVLMIYRPPALRPPACFHTTHVCLFFVVHQARSGRWIGSTQARLWMVAPARRMPRAVISRGRSQSSGDDPIKRY